MGWVKDWHTFPARRKLLQLPRGRALVDALNMLDSSPEALEVALRGIIKQYRPELADCTICAMAMNYERGAWEVHIEHPSLPEEVPGSAPHREMLCKEGSL